MSKFHWKSLSDFYFRLQILLDVFDIDFVYIRDTFIPQKQ